MSDDHSASFASSSQPMSPVRGLQVPHLRLASLSTPNPMPQRVQPTPNRASYAPGASCSTPFSRFRGRSTKDPRNLDKPYCQHALKNLCSVLDELQYTVSIDPKKFLVNPTSKDFVQICQFLYACIDPIGAAEWNKKNGEDVADLAKALRYPVTVAKSALKAVGTPSTWPQLVGLVDWLVNLVMWDLRGNQLRLQKWVDHLLDINDMYATYMAGYDDAVEKRVNERISALKDELIQKEECILALQKQTAKLKKKYESGREPLRLAEIVENLDTVQAELPQRQLYCDKKRLHLKQLRDSLGHLNAKHAPLRTQRDRRLKDRNGLKQQVEKQQITVEEEQERIALVNELTAQIKAQRQEEVQARAALRQKEEHIAAQLEKLEKLKEQKDNSVENGAKLHDARRQTMTALDEVNMHIDVQSDRRTELTRLIEDNFIERAQVVRMANAVKEEIAACNEQYRIYASAPCLPLFEDISDSPAERLRERKEEAEEERKLLHRELQDLDIELKEAQNQQERAIREILDMARTKKSHFQRLTIQHSR